MVTYPPHMLVAVVPPQAITEGLQNSMPDTCRFQPVLLQTVMAACMSC